jgi:hypothetical protein
MKRKLYKKLLVWKNSEFRKPLLIKGARQVGKSYILKEFGNNEFSGCHIFNFEKDQKLFQIFESDLVPDRITKDFSIYIGKKIDEDKDLLIFDEIQECPRAMTALKYFCEEMPKLSICCAGSLIGVKMSSEAFPVGKVEFLNMHPMTFEEFLTALDDEMCMELLKTAPFSDQQSEIAHLRLWDRLKEYYAAGGMPEVVASYVHHRENQPEALNTARLVQKRLIEGYFKDFAKHSGKTNSMHIVSVLENVPMQMVNNINGSVKRYRFKNVVSGKKSFADLQGPIDWLEKAGLIIKVKVCNRAELPLEAFCKNNMFKLFMFDVGLLGCMLDIPPGIIVSQEFGIAKGYFAENFTAQEFTASGVEKLYSWTERNSEIEFLRVIKDAIIPIEVKSGTRTQAKSLVQFIRKYSPEKAIKITGKALNKKKGGTIDYYPLYLAGMVDKIFRI